MKSRGEIIKKLEEILIDVLDIDEKEFVDSLEEETQLIGGVGSKDIGVSSIDYVEFIIEVEKEFKVVLDIEKMINTIGDLIDEIELQQ